MKIAHWLIIPGLTFSMFAAACGNGLEDDDPKDPTPTPTASTAPPVQPTQTPAASPTAQQTPAPAPRTTTVIPASTGVDCRPGDKVGTWSEVSGAGPQRIEVGGHGTQHLDFYPARGVKAMSYIVQPIANPDGTPNIAFGHGSIWEWNPPGCSYDHVTDATNYAKARLDSGHSGIVIDLRVNPPQVVANVSNLSQDAVRALLNVHAAAMERNGTKLSFSNISFGSNAAVATTPSAGECKAQTKTLPPGSNVTVKAPAIANVWTNKPSPPPWGQAEVKVRIDSDTELTNVGGTVYEYPSGCDVSGDFAKNGLPEKSVADLRQYGLVK